jgi:hypothetical protein
VSDGPGQRPAPQVTVTDPNRPAGAPADVLGSGTERDPWRPQTWQLNAVALAVALAAAVVLPGRVVTARAQDRRAAVAAAEAVRLSVVPGDPGQARPGRLRVVVSDDTRDAVRLLDVRLDGPGYRRVDPGSYAAACRLPPRPTPSP